MSALENPSTQGSTLTDLEGRILDFERNWWRFAGAKETAIKELFDLTAPRYYQLLNDLIDREDALLAEHARRYVADVRVNPNPAAALTEARRLAAADGAVLVTGSLYLLAELAEERA